ncbi:MAG: hypothetical protein EAX86_08745 [Candidatus Heimdallarchaeota archaeon]|nr:hypothetical protein [Candidatus Heimdallarchaeota archaeon]
MFNARTIRTIHKRKNYQEKNYFGDRIICNLVNNGEYNLKSKEIQNFERYPITSILPFNLTE